MVNEKVCPGCHIRSIWPDSAAALADRCVVCVRMEALMAKAIHVQIEYYTGEHVWFEGADECLDVTEITSRKALRDIVFDITPLWAWGTKKTRLQLSAEELLEAQWEENSVFGEESVSEVLPQSSIASLQRLLDQWCKDEDRTMMEIDETVVVHFDNLPEGDDEGNARAHDDSGGTANTSE